MSGRSSQKTARRCIAGAIDIAGERRLETSAVKAALVNLPSPLFRLSGNTHREALRNMKYLRRLSLKRGRTSESSLLSLAAVQDNDEVRRSGIFDADWYLRQYPDVAEAHIDPLWHYMTYGWRELRNPNSLFDTKWYLDTYPDVHDAEINPLLHYTRHGAIERRDIGPDFQPSVFQDDRTSRGVHHLAAALAYLRKIALLRDERDQSVFAAERVLIVAELSIPQCRKYRVDQKRELLHLLGHQSTVLNWHDVGKCEAALTTHSMVIFYRVPAAAGVLNYIEKAKAAGLPTIIQVYKKIFEQKIKKKNSGLKFLSPAVQRSVLSGVPAYRAAMLACDEVIASTRSLAVAMRDAGAVRAHVVENALDAQTLKVALGIASKRYNDGIVRIVYGSGTNTHDADFLEAADGIRACLDTYPHVNLRIIGELNLPKDFVRFGRRIERFATTSYARYLELMRACHIAIAPLEPTLFNDAKSNIKYIEASIVGLPSVCSPRAEFASIIAHGRNGMLAEKAESWFASVEALVLNPDLRDTIGQAANETVVARYSPQNIAETQLAQIVSRAKRPRKPLRVLAVNVFFEPRSFGGATIVAEQMAYRLNERPDCEVVVFTTAPPGTTRPYELVTYRANHIPVFAICLPETYEPALSFESEHTVHSFREVLRATKPDVVHFHSIQGLGALLLEVCTEEGVPFVVTLHDAWWICGRQFMIKGDGKYCFQTQIDLNICSSCVPDAGLNVFRQYRLHDMLSRANLLLAPSRFLQGIYDANNFSTQRLKVNRNGIARPTNFQRVPSDRLRFGYVGGNATVKGALLIQKVFAELEYTNYDLVIIDNITSLGFSSIAHDSWRINGELKVLPAYGQDNMDSFYSQIDVLLFPTQCKESFGLTVREALIRDIWVITTDAGGVVEDVMDGENGDIIPLLDDGTALKLAVERALDRVDDMKHHHNHYKSKIVDHEQQAEELYRFLYDTSLEKVTVTADPQMEKAH